MTKFFYMRVLGFFMVALGLGYCLTSFFNFYSYIYGELVLANANVFVMAVGLVFPLYIFIFGIFFFFYSDKNFAEINPFVFTSGIMMFIVGIIRIFVENGIMQFIHFSFAYVILILAIALLYGCIKYKY